jgi:uncharacterized Zn finger protein
MSKELKCWYCGHNERNEIITPCLGGKEIHIRCAECKVLFSAGIILTKEIQKSNNKD